MKETDDYQHFRDIVYVHKTEVYRIIISVVEDHYIADELAQIVMIKAWKGFSKLRTPGRSKAWVKAITRNVIRDYMSEKSIILYEKDKAVLGELIELDELSIIERDILDALVEKEDVKTVFAALDLLDDKYRIVVKMNLLMEIPLKDIADQFGMNPGTVRMIYSRGIKKLGESYRMLEKGGVING